MRTPSWNSLWRLATPPLPVAAPAAVLLAIQDFKNEISENEGITEYFRECKKYLNHYAAVTTMEFLDSEDIRKLAFDYMMNLRHENNNKKSGVRRKNKR